MKQIGAHRHQFAGAARRAVEPADQFLPPRLGSEMQLAGISVVRLRAPALDRLRKPLAVRADLASQGFEEPKPARLVEMVVTVENLARHRGTGGLAATGQQ